LNMYKLLRREALKRLAELQAEIGEDLESKEERLKCATCFVLSFLPSGHCQSEC